MALITIVGVAVLGLTLSIWGVASWVDPGRRIPCLIEVGGGAADQRTILLLGLLLAFGSLPGTQLHIVR